MTSIASKPEEQKYFGTSVGYFPTWTETWRRVWETKKFGGPTFRIPFLGTKFHCNVGNFWWPIF